MRLGVTISTIGHVVVLVATLLSFTATRLKSMEDSVPVDVVSDAELSKLTAGLKTAAKVDDSKAMADKVGEAMPAKDQAGKVVDKKPEIRTASAEAAPPVTDPKTKTETKVDQKKPAEKTDEIAEALKKEVKKSDPKPAPPKKPQPKLDMSKIESKLALIDKREAQRQTITNTMISPASLGTSNPNSRYLSQGWAAAFRARVESCWDIPAGSLDVANLAVKVRIQINRDGTLATEPVVVDRNSNPAFRVAAEASVRAIRRCAPYAFLPLSQYEDWKDFEAIFIPADMYGGTTAAATRF